MQSKDLHTKNCVRCLVRPAVMFTGHVTRGDDTVTSGWCDPCFAQWESSPDGFKGWDGHYIEAMGTQVLADDEPPSHLTLVSTSASPESK